MGDADDEDNKGLVEDLVDDAVVAKTETVGVASGDLEAPPRTGFSSRERSTRAMSSATSRGRLLSSLAAPDLI